LREATKLHTDRFTAAAAQLGDGSSSAIQLAGVHALAGLADDAPTRALRQTCIDVLCAYLRMPYDPDPGDLPTDATPDQTDEHATARHTYRALREVRHTLIRVITAHLRDDAEVSWQGHDLDFTGVDFDGGDFSGAVFTADPDRNLHGRITFSGATFSGKVVIFSGATFSSGTVNFSDATFSGSTVTFDRATFSSDVVYFNGATFSGSTVTFARAMFSGSTVNFDRAMFSSGRVDLSDATFSSGEITFSEARFSMGPVDFSATFSGGKVTFRGAAGRLVPDLLADPVVKLPAAWLAAPHTGIPPQ
jgi:uncharacterized protein YjbI with pentapeptide repeats